MTARVHLASPAPGAASSAAIAIVELRGEVDRVLSVLGIARVDPGRTGLREARGIDTLIVARLSEDHAMLFPHAGPVVVQRLMSALQSAGAIADLTEETPPPPSAPPSLDKLNTLLWSALSRAASPLAIDLLLDQPRRWAAAAGHPDRVLTAASSRSLARLIDPPLIVALGPPNVGKSSLLNALAGREVAIVADQPGTTRDHVGALINLAGLVVRFVDAPGVGRAAAPDDPDADERSLSLALSVAAAADLVLWCGDAASGFLPDGVASVHNRLRVALRADLGRPADPHDLAVALPPEGGPGPALGELVAALRERLVPATVLADERAWAFWLPARK